MLLGSTEQQWDNLIRSIRAPGVDKSHYSSDLLFCSLHSSTTKRLTHIFGRSEVTKLLVNRLEPMIVVSLSQPVNRGRKVIKLMSRVFPIRNRDRLP